MAGFLIIILLLVFTLSLSKLTQSLQKRLVARGKANSQKIGYLKIFMILYWIKILLEAREQF